jgi:hypothetical protein
MVAPSSGLLRVLIASAFCMAASSAFANTNEQFSAQVRAHRSAMTHDESAVGQAARHCTALAPNRAMDEPQCVAWRLHMRALSDKERTETCDTSELSAITLIRRCFLGSLTGSAA